MQSISYPITFLSPECKQRYSKSMPGMQRTCFRLVLHDSQSTRIVSSPFQTLPQIIFCVAHSNSVLPVLKFTAIAMGNSQHFYRQKLKRSKSTKLYALRLVSPSKLSHSHSLRHSQKSQCLWRSSSRPASVHSHSATSSSALPHQRDSATLKVIPRKSSRT